MRQDALALVVALALILLALTTPRAHAVDLAGYGQLVTAIYTANENARACKGARKCLGKAVTLDLTRDVTIVEELPPLSFNAHLIVRGVCQRSASDFSIRACTINGQKKFRIFLSTPVGGPTARLEVSNLRFVNALGGVFFNFWGPVTVKNCVFSNNAYGVEISGGLMGGYPTRLFQNSTFVSNVGSVFRRGSSAQDVGTANGEYRIRSCTFLANQGKGSQADGAAMALYGSGSASAWDTLFLNNSGSIGGAVNVVQSSIKFLRATFRGNKARLGKGNDVAASTTKDGNSEVNFCFTTFPYNVTKQQARNSSAVYLLSPEDPSGTTFANLCNTTLPAGSIFKTARITKDCSQC